LFTPLVPPRPDFSLPIDRRPTRVVTAIGRLAPGVTTAQAEQEGTAIARAQPRPVSAGLVLGNGGPVEVEVRSLTEHITAGVSPMLWLLAAGAGLVLVITCANVGGLSLVRHIGRERELSVRMALGAERRHLRRQVACECLMIAQAAVALGLALAAMAVRMLPAFAPASLTRLQDVAFDAPVIFVVMAVSLAAGGVAMFLPALPSLRAAGASLRGGAATHTANVTRRHGALIAAEAAIAVVLVVAAALLTRSLAVLMAVDTGFSDANVVTARVTLQGSRDLSRRWTTTAGAILERLRTIDGVDEAGASNMAPFGDTNHVVGFRLPAAGAEPEIARVLGYVVTPGYMEALRIPLRRGRVFTTSDVGSGTQPVLVNEEYVRQYIRHGSAVGQQYVDTLAPAVLSEIVGVVANVLKDGLERPPQPEIYVLAGHHGALTTGRQINVAVRSGRDAAMLAGVIRDAVRQADPAAAVHNVTTLDAERAAALAQPRLATLTLVWFAATSLALVAAGLYGVLSYLVARRRRELAIRAALGADRVALAGSVLRPGLIQTGLGVALGLTLAAAGARSVQALLFGVSPFDPWSFAAAAVIVGLVTTAASAAPALSATRLDLSRTLREPST
jgi:predicted permease